MESELYIYREMATNSIEILHSLEKAVFERNEEKIITLIDSLEQSITELGEIMIWLPVISKTNVREVFLYTFIYVQYLLCSWEFPVIVADDIPDDLEELRVIVACICRGECLKALQQKTAQSLLLTAAATTGKS